MFNCGAPFPRSLNLRPPSNETRRQRRNCQARIMPIFKSFDKLINKPRPSLVCSLCDFLPISTAKESNGAHPTLSVIVTRIAPKRNCIRLLTSSVARALSKASILIRSYRKQFGFTPISV